MSIVGLRDEEIDESGEGDLRVGKDDGLNCWGHRLRRGGVQCLNRRQGWIREVAPFVWTECSFPSVEASRCSDSRR